MFGSIAPRKEIKPAPAVQPVTEPVAQPVDQDKSLACENKRLIPNRAMFFDNDLTPEEKEQLVQGMADAARAALEQDKVSVNTVAKLLSIEHNKARTGLSISTSLKGFLSFRKESGALSKAKRAMARLTPDERALLLQQIAGADK
jgi:hypothetical protein